MESENIYADFSPDEIKEMLRNEFIREDFDFEIIRELYVLLDDEIEPRWVDELFMLYHFEAIFALLEGGLSPDFRTSKGYSLLHSFAGEADHAHDKYMAYEDDFHWELLTKCREALKKFVETYTVDFNPVNEKQTPLDFLIKNEDWAYNYLVSKGAVHFSGEKPVYREEISHPPPPRPTHATVWLKQVE